MKEYKLRIAFLLLLLAGISVLFLAMIRQFLMTILLAAIFAGLAFPMYSRLVNWFRNRRALAALATLLVVLVLIVGPLLAFLGILSSQAFEIAQSATPWIQEHLGQPDSFDQLIAEFPTLEKLAPYRDEIVTKLGQAATAIGEFLVSGFSATTRGTISFLFHFSLLLYSIFFFLIDGPALLKKIRSYIPLAPADKDRLADKFLSVTRATIKGTLVIGILQGGLAGVGFAVAGIGSSVFWGTIMVVLSIIPGIGTALVWVPASLYFIFTGKILIGVLLGLWCGLVVGSIDNFLRPVLVGRDTKMHELLILFGTLGGLFFFGVVGFIIGPVIAALFVTTWEIYAVVFREALPEISEVGSDPD
ncbi:MAG: AI-2E family transporter [Candidatus Latescibacterota bacterium]|nr:MAG: AI-2E family transporter [Candidatus Latescibacterota bacterium]